MDSPCKILPGLAWLHEGRWRTKTPTTDRGCMLITPKAYPRSNPMFNGSLVVVLRNPHKQGDSILK